ncbi:MAG: DNA polymerase III subunit beta [Sulfurihydrogenibium sp.]|jgi:DNA polymerase III sliding clamp (beta) subunit (PCNA family)|nr:DNA polymerase III subunit beta [Sulfurihydrogenibium sp.]
MKARINTKALKNAIERMAYIPRGYQMFTKITAEAGTITIEASAPYLYSKEVIKADLIIEAGTVILDSSELKKALKSIKAPELIISSETGKCIISADKDFKLHTYMIQQFKKAENEAGFKAVINGSELKEALNRTVHILYKEKEKTKLPIDNLGLIFRDNGILDVMGATYYRLALYTINYSGNYTGKLLIPKDISEQLKKILDNKDIELNIISRDKKNYIQIIESNYLLELETFSEGYYKYNYPDYNNVVLTDINFTAVLKREPILNSLKDLLNTIQNDFHFKITFKFTDNKLELITRKGIKSEIQTDTKGDFEIAFNGNYLIDFLKSFTGEYFIIEAWKSDFQANFKSAEEPNYIYLLAPVFD